MNLKKSPQIYPLTAKIKKIEPDVIRVFLHDKLVVACKGLTHFIDLDNICFLKSESNYTRIVQEENKSLLVCKTLKNFSIELKNRSFLRVHSSYLVNLDKVVSLRKQGKPCLILENGYEVPISRKFAVDVIPRFMKG